MTNELFNGNFRRFFSTLDEQSKDMSVFPQAISESVKAVAEDAHIGRFYISFRIPQPPTDDSTNGEAVMYLSPEGFEEKAEVFEFSTGDGGRTIFTVNPVKGYEWSEEEKDTIRFLCRTIFIFGSRTRLSSIAHKSVYYDIPMGLLNSSGFIAEGMKLFNRKELHNYTAMYANIKNFKFINTHLGSRHGDEALIAYSAALKKAMDGKGVVARLGGDNFAFLVKKEYRDEILDFLSCVQITLSIGFMDTSYNMSARVGVYEIMPGDNMGLIMNCVTSAINAAKFSITNDVVILNSDNMKRIIHEQAVNSAFPGAVENKEFVVHYQPKVNLRESRLCGCEALVRWMKDGSLIPPKDFIPILERNGCICTLDFYVLERVCMDINSWLQKGLEPVTVSVNFSKTHLCNPNIAEDIMAIINKHGIDSKYIEIEMTEMSDYNDYEVFKSLVTKMKENGIITSIDDFGTGYSSLNLLTDFNFDIVKLDKSFLDNVVKNHSITDEIVIRNIVRMIKELNMKAIAEGVETVEQAKLLKDLDCTMVQGFLYDRPLCIEEFEKRLKNKEYERIV